MDAIKLSECDTIEEAAKNYQNIYQIRPSQFAQDDFIAGAKWQQERSYSEKEVLDILYKHTEDLLAGKKLTLEEWFEQFKKK